MMGKEAVRRATDPDRLLPGEDPGSRNHEDAQHWVAVYEELHRFKLDLIGQTRSRMAAMNPAARGEVEDVALAIMEEQSDRLDRRLQFWKTRLDALLPNRTR
ncbi:MAG TPA: hypothetical protein VIT43_03460 [Candidatus Dormibacteraeota bacterium]